MKRVWSRRSVGQVHNFEVLSSSSVLLLLLFAATSGLSSVALIVVVDDIVSNIMHCAALKRLTNFAQLLT